MTFVGFLILTGSILAAAFLSGFAMFVARQALVSNDDLAERVGNLEAKLAANSKATTIGSATVNLHVDTTQFEAQMAKVRDAIAYTAPSGRQA